ncbi:hypothetical protein [Millisia brevis]|uniref:hypothetical protein n=1 Tax=Millisia brevis TaxID=264148 RepID=UPI00083088C1|nr:hypothetical protein [Millisia brevis]
MSIWQSETKLNISADPDAIWHRWSTPDLWPQDDPDTRAAFLEVPAAAGVSGWAQPRRGPRSALTVTRADQPSALDFRSSFPGATMSFEHELTPIDDTGYAMTHRLVFEGPLAGIWGRLIGASIARGFPSVMGSIVRNAGGHIT